LDDVMHELSTSDREAVLMRYFERRPLAEIGKRLGLTENTARMRVERALDKLREGLARRGVTSTLSALTLLLGERAVGAAPAGLAGRVGRTATAAGASGGLALFLWKLLTPASLKWAVAGTAFVAVAIWLASSQHPAANARALDQPKPAEPSPTVAAQDTTTSHQ